MHSAISAARSRLQAEYADAADALRAVPGVGSGLYGMTPDAVKATPEYRAARGRLDAAFAALRGFNKCNPPGKRAPRYK